MNIGSVFGNVIVSNDDLNYTLNSKPRLINSPTLVEENETETHHHFQWSSFIFIIIQWDEKISSGHTSSINWLQTWCQNGISRGKCVLPTKKTFSTTNRMNYSSPVSGGYFRQDFIRGFIRNGSLSPNILAG